MTPRRWFVIATMLMLAAVSYNAAAGNLGKIVNGDFEQLGGGPCDVPGWMDDHFEASGVGIDTDGLGQADFGTCRTAQVQGLGVNNSVALLVVGTEVRRSADLFPVAAGNVSFSFDVQEVRPDDDGEPTFNGDSVGAIEFVNATGSTLRSLSVICDEYVDIYDSTGVNLLTDNDCSSAADGYFHLEVPSSRTDIKLKYRSLVAPAGTTYGRVLLGGSLALDVIDPIFFGIGLNSPTSVTLFDNVSANNTA